MISLPIQCCKTVCYRFDICKNLDLEKSLLVYLFVMSVRFEMFFQTALPSYISFSILQHPFRLVIQ